MRRLQGVDERIAFVYLAVGSVLGFVAQLPGLVRRAQLSDPEFEALLTEESARVGVAIPTDMADAKFEALFSGAVMAWIFIVPIAFYGLAFVSHIGARLLGGQGTGLRARAALFWSFLAVMPGLLLLGLTVGFVGPGPAQAVVFSITLSGFFWIWLNSLYVAERPHV
ncbi:YIP1 family protein [Jannaschia sp. M317]|uniref:YIP1 family protein n=1 Tax=Jannaschia sp. M317 TaxID=2867011 RepID=UPI0021A8B9E6|nr:YIP1 family protein [Jannaschia sp. M317]UWQ16538.1 YIP1 family protein [Jannaschia sp. M317]